MNEAAEKAIDDLLRSPTLGQRKSLLPSGSLYNPSTSGARNSVQT